MEQKPLLPKKLVDFCKKHKLPQKLIIIIVFFILIGQYVKRFLTKKSVCLSLVSIGIILGLTIQFIRKTPADNYFKPELAEVSITRNSDWDTTRPKDSTRNTTEAATKEATIADTTIKKETTKETTTKETTTKKIEVTKEGITETTSKKQYRKSPIDIPGLNRYFIRVNRKANCVTVYTYDQDGNYTVPVKAMICSTGGEKTPLGTYGISEKYIFRALLYDVYGQYAVRFNGPILFHSSSYSKMQKDSLIAEEFNKLGKSISHGCVRLQCKDAKWIYDHCELGTQVEVYEAKNPGPLGKPKAIQIPKNSKWDPTDTDENNPWKDKKPNITGAQDKILYRGASKLWLYVGVKATDTCGNDITGDIQIRGNYDLDRPGKYEVTYFVKDLLGKKVKKKVTLMIV